MSTLKQKLAAHASSTTIWSLHEMPVAARAQAAEMLNRLLVEILDVALCARHAHWNARGVDFLDLHERLETIGTRLDVQANRVARRIGELGGTAHGTAQHIVTESSFRPYPVEVAEGQDHLDALALRLGLLSAEARLAIYDCKGLGDPVTIDLLARVNTEIDQLLWMVERQLVRAH